MTVSGTVKQNKIKAQFNFGTNKAENIKTIQDLHDIFETANMI